MLVMAVAVGARITYAREGEPARGPHVWRPMVLFAGGWLVLGVLLRLSVTVSGSASALSLFSGYAQGHAGAGLGLPSLVTVALLWALASAAAGPAVARFLASAAPGAAVKLGGRATSGEWRLLLADSVLVRGAKMPPALAAAETALRSGARPRVAPLGQHPVRDRAVLAGAVTLVGLVLVGTVGYSIVADTVYGPDRAVSNYFSALQAGNADRALAMVGSQDLKGLDRSLLTSAALRGAHVPDIKVGDVQRHGSSASVQVTEGGDSFSMDLVQQGKAQRGVPGLAVARPVHDLADRDRHLGGTSDRQRSVRFLAERAGVPGHLHRRAAPVGGARRGLQPGHGQRVRQPASCAHPDAEPAGHRGG